MIYLRSQFEEAVSRLPTFEGKTMARVLAAKKGLYNASQKDEKVASGWNTDIVIRSKSARELILEAEKDGNASEKYRQAAMQFEMAGLFSRAQMAAERGNDKEMGKIYAVIADYLK